MEGRDEYPQSGFRNHYVRLGSLGIDRNSLCFHNDRWHRCARAIDYLGQD
jgi:hypothetical protein